MTARSVLVVGAATSLDRYARAPEVRVGGITRPTRVVELAGGKALNAARSARRLGAQVRAVALAGGAPGDRVRALAADEGLPVRWVATDAPTRQCLCLLDETSGLLTEVYEPLLPVSASAADAFWSAVWDEVDTAPDQVVVLSGRLPTGLDPVDLSTLVEHAVRSGRTVLVDSDGAPLAAALAARPHVVKVNGDEAARVAGHGDDHRANAEELRRRGAQTVVVTLGARGALVVLPDGSHAEVTHAPVDGALPVGSGDAFLGAVATALAARPSGADLSTASLLGAVGLGAAAARANARVLEAGSVSPDLVAAERGDVEVRTAR